MSGKTILILCAHSDDQILGAGGAMAKYAKKGYDVITVIFTYGETSHPHIKKEDIRKVRVNESEAANKVIGGKDVLFLGFTDGNMGAELKEDRSVQKVKTLIKKYNPSKIFTHSVDDMLPDHRAVKKCVLRAYDELHSEFGFVCEVYSFEVWNLLNVLKRQKPRLIVDISKEFGTKIRALHKFKSQISIFTHTVFVHILYFGVYVKGFLNGIKYGHAFTEVYYKIR